MQDFYKNLCKDMLRKYMQVRETTHDIDLRIQELNDRLTNTTVRYGVDPVQGGGTSQEDVYLNTIAKRAMLEHNNRVNKSIVSIVEKALKEITDKEADIVIRLYASDEKNVVLKLMEEYHYEKRNIYYIANKALKTLSYKMFGDA